MSRSKIPEEVIIEKLNNLSTKIENVHQDLKLEMQELKVESRANTEFRLQAKGMVTVVAAVASFVGGLIMLAVSKIWKG